MRCVFAALLCVGLATQADAVRQRPHCQRGEYCWPKERHISRLRRRLDPEMPRTLLAEAGGPYISALVREVPGLQDWEKVQPLFGLGAQGMSPLYVRETLNQTCQDEREYDTDYCKAQITNVLSNVEPDFVVFALNAEHIRTSVRFARRHRLCIVVAGTGHEFNGRNQPLHCTGGSILIRTTLMRSKEADLQDEAGLGHPSFRFGAGMVFSEAHQFAAQYGMMVSSGSCPSVGVVGWSLGGGYGPHCPRLGLGVDNLLAADVVLASGRYVTVTADGPHKDLFWALRGGGGSTWGIITHVTVKAHPLPDGGLSLIAGVLSGPITDVTSFELVARAWTQFSLELNQNVTFSGGYLFSKPQGYWAVQASCYVQGGLASPEAQKVVQKLVSLGLPETLITQVPIPDSYAFTNYAPNKDSLVPWSSGEGAYPPISGALIPREQVSQAADFVISQSVNCPAFLTCGQALSGGLTGNIGSPQQPFTSISSAMRKAALMYLAYTTPQDVVQEAFGPYVYFSESNPNLNNSAYWEEETYNKLRLVKKKYDCRGVFGCRNCVGL